MPTPLDLATLPRSAAALRRLLLQREMITQQNSNSKPPNCKPPATDCRS
jgi:hypothetical protein